MHIALTGATGFIGRRLQQALLHLRHRLTALVRPAQHQRRPELLTGIEQLPFDQLDCAAWRDLLDREDAPEAVILLAGAVRGRTFQQFARVNERPFTALAYALEGLTAPPRLLLMSSLAATQPSLSPYAASKRAGEVALSARSVTVLRPPAVYGPGDRELAGLFQTIRRGWVPRPGPVDQRICFLHVDDLANAVVAWLQCAPGQDDLDQTFTLHDGAPNGYSWPEIAAAIAPHKHARILPVPKALLHAVGTANLLAATALRYAPMLTPGKARELGYPRWLCDNRAFTEATGWEPAVDLATGTARLRNETNDD
ncbi:MAG: NAD(P)-dependent oxidoreductase [Pseudomonadota bacterium]